MLRGLAIQRLFHFSFSVGLIFNISLSFLFQVLVKRKADFHLEEGGKAMPAWICILKVSPRWHWKNGVLKDQAIPKMKCINESMFLYVFYSLFIKTLSITIYNKVHSLINSSMFCLNKHLWVFCLSLRWMWIAFLCLLYFI